MLDANYDGSNFVVRRIFFCGGDKDEFDEWKKGLRGQAASALMGLGFGRIPTRLGGMETATVTVEGDRQTVRLPRSVHLPPTVFVRQNGDTVVLEPAKPKTWPEGFFDSIHVTDPAFERPEQGQLPPVRNL